MWNWRYCQTLFKACGKTSQITCVDPNKGMIKKGKEKLDQFKNLKWVLASAEKLPIEIILLILYH